MKKTYSSILKKASSEEFKPSYAKVIGATVGGGVLGAAAGAYTGGQLATMPYGRRYLHFDENIKSKNIHLTPQQRRVALQDIADQGKAAHRRGTKRGAAVGAALGAIAGGYGQYKQQLHDHNELQRGSSPASVKAKRSAKNRNAALNAAYIAQVLIPR